MLRVLIVDDEFKSRELLKVLLETYCEDVTVVGTAENVQAGREAVLQLLPDVLLLDVEMGAETGFDLLEQLPLRNAEVIFITAHAHYAIKAIKFAAIDYLLKPVDPEELKAALERVARRRSQTVFQRKVDVLFQHLHQQTNGSQKIALPTSDGLLFVPVEEIVYCEADGAYTAIHLKNAGKIFVSKNLKEYEVLLTEHRFFRVHNSFLINLQQVKKYVRGEGGYVIMSNNATVDVAKRKKDAFLQAIASV